MSLADALPTRLREKFTIDPESDCWVWTACVTATGYGRAWDGQKADWAHRVIYRAVGRKIDDELFIDHMCHNRDAHCLGGPTCPHRRCVNPDHMEPSTCLENTRRGRSAEANSARAKVVTNCKHGHPFAGDNVRISKAGARICRACQDIATRRYRDANREKILAKSREADRKRRETDREKINADARRRWAERTTCNSGHLLTAESIVFDAAGRRRCKACRDAMADRTRGSRSVNARLTEQQVADVRNMLAQGDLQRVVAARFGVSQITISRIARGERYREAPGEPRPLSADSGLPIEPVQDPLWPSPGDSWSDFLADAPTDFTGSRVLRGVDTLRLAPEWAGAL